MSYIQRITKEYSTSFLSTDELSLYARHLLLPEIGTVGQLKLKTARVLVVGAGGLGCPLLQSLAGAGVGSLTVLDPDAVDQSNITRQWLHRFQDVGRNKAESAVEAVRLLNPYTQIVGMPLAFSSENAEEFVAGYDLVVDATDDFQARQCIDVACATLGRPWVHAALYRNRFQVSVFWAQYGAKYSDLFSGMGDAPDCASAGVLGATAALAGNSQAWEVIKLITGCEVVEPGVLVNFHAPSLSSSKFRLPDVRSPELFALESEAEPNVWSMDRLRQAISIHEPLELFSLSGPLHISSDIVLPEIKEIVAERILEAPESLSTDRIVCLICDTGAVSEMLASALNATSRMRPVVSMAREEFVRS